MELGYEEMESNFGIIFMLDCGGRHSCHRPQ